MSSPYDPTVLNFISSVSNFTTYAHHTSALNSLQSSMSESDDRYTWFVLNFLRIAEGMEREGREGKGEGMQIALTSLYLFKNNVAHPPTIPSASHPAVLSQSAIPEIKTLLLFLLSSPFQPIKNGATTTISTLVSESKIIPLATWPELMVTLSNLLSSPTPTSVETGLKTIYKISSDDPHLLESPTLGAPLNAIIPSCISLLNPQTTPGVLKPTLDIMTLYSSTTFPNSLIPHVNNLLENLSLIATNDDGGVRKRVVECISAVMGAKPEYIKGKLPGIAEFMINVMSDSDSGVKLKATEFWMYTLEPNAYSKSYADVWVGQGCMDRVVPILCRNMVYTEEEREVILERNTEEDEGRNLRPVFHKSRKGGGEDDDEDDDDEGFDDGEDNSWSLRKASAQTLDYASAVTDPKVLLNVLLPNLKAGFESGEPWVREAAVLALGAIGGDTATGRYMEEYMGQIYPFLVSQLTSPLPQLASVAAWAMSRYVPWVVYMVERGGEPGMLNSHVEALLNAAKGKSGKTRLAAVSSISATVEVAGGDHISHMLGGIYQVMNWCLDNYQLRARIGVYDLLACVADVCGESSGSKGIGDIWVGKVVGRWKELQAMSQHHDYQGEERQAEVRGELLRLLECVACSAVAMGMTFAQWGREAMELCIQGCQANILRVVTLNENEKDRKEEDDDMDSDVIVCCLDVIDGMVEGMGNNFAGLINSIQGEARERFLPLLQQCTVFDVSGVRMSSLAVVGDLCKYCPQVIEPGLENFLKCMIINMNGRRWVKVVNNALWGFGEMCLRCKSSPAPLLPFKEKILSAIVPLLMSQQVGIVENACACMGRLGMVDGKGFGLETVMAGKMDVWFDGIGKIYDRDEKRDALVGSLALIRAHPVLIMDEGCRRSAISAFLMMVASFHVRVEEGGDFREMEHDDLYHAHYMFERWPGDMGEELRAEVGGILQEIGRGLGAEASVIIKALPLNVKKLLKQEWGVGP